MSPRRRCLRDRSRILSGDDQITAEPVGTLGGRRLRALRQAARRTQLWVELEAELGTGYLQRLESGRVLQPARQTITRILDALDARYTERREIMEAYGYLVPAQIPTDAEIEWAISLARRELDAVDFPAVVVDCAQRLIAWNDQLPRLFGVRYIASIERRSFLAPWFDPQTPIGATVTEPDQLLPAMIRASIFEFQDYTNEPWYPDVLAELQRIERFRHYQSVVRSEPAVATAARAIVPLRLSIPGTGQLEFHLAAEHFIRDARFRLVHYFPADLKTIGCCTAWAVDASH